MEACETCFRKIYTACILLSSQRNYQYLCPCTECLIKVLCIDMCKARKLLRESMLVNERMCKL
jgi:hypothetical protein